MATAKDPAELVKPTIVERATVSKDFRGYLMSAAIDIGTSSSCYAFSYRSSPYEVRMNKNWSGQDSFQSYKTPTTILTEKGSDGKYLAFGYEAERKYRELVADGNTTDYNLYTDFKMILYREQKLKLKETMATSLIGTKRPLLDLYVMTFEHMRKHMISEIDVSGASKVSEREVRWVLCVPATWTDKAKNFLRHAAYKARMIDDIQSTQLVIILEATAAALYCQRPETRFSTKHLLETDTAMAVPKGTKYLIVDAGAGTVDFTAQQAINKKQVKEIAIACGGDWGGRHIDKRFVQLLKQVLGDSFIEDFRKKYPLQWFDLELAFEQAKATVDENGKSINVQLPSVMERYMRQEYKKEVMDVIAEKSKTHGVKENNGYFVISHQKVREMFDPTIKQICEETGKMVDMNQLKDLNMIFLVGGFAACKLLQSKIKEQFPEKKIAVPMDARAAVVMGAVIYGHDPSIIIRVAKKTYGVTTYSPFDPKKHSQAKKTTVGKSELCADLFLPFVQKGEELQPGTHGHMVASPVKATATNIVVDFYHMDRTTSPDEVLYNDSKGVHKHGTVRVDMPNTDQGLKREVMLYFTFNDEINVVAVDESSATKTKKKVTLNFDYDVRN